MRRIQLPEPPCPTSRSGTPDIFESGVHTFVRRAIVIGNGFAASENQSVGLVRALGLSDKHVLYEKKLVPLPSENGVGAGLLAVLEADVKEIVSFARETYEKEGPLLVVACGRDTISTASSIKRLASENAFVVQIQNPRLHLNRFDMVITPKHDYYPLTPEGQKQVPWFLRSWITPRDPPDCHVLAASLLSVLASCGSVRISFSERTPQKVSNIIVKELGSNPKVYIWDGQGHNRHMGHLAWADAFVVTADSVSMISEACSTGKPVYVLGAEHCKWKFTEFHKSLREQGVVRPFTGSEDISESWSYPPLTDTADAAKKVHEALAARGWKLKV
ncbi:Mitochondrial fission protein ELM1 [Glycine max]|nr:Mitochondrial fission protein ELM1 [Glycine max]